MSAQSLATRPAPASTAVSRRRIRSRPTRTRLVTLHRLPSGARVHDALSYVFYTPMEHAQADAVSLSIAGNAAVLVHAPVDPKVPDWCPDIQRITGVPLRYETNNAGALLFVDVDGRVYVVGYGVGHLWLTDDAKDPGFGLGVALRGIDAERIHTMVRRPPGQRGRTDSTLVAGGVGIWHLGLERHYEVIRQIGGRALDLQLTSSRDGKRPVKLVGSAGLSFRLATEPDDFVEDIRVIAAVAAQPNPHPDLAFAENVTLVTGRATLEDLDERLEADLATRDPEADSDDRLSLAVPQSALEHLPLAHGYRFKIGSVARSVPDLSIGDLLQRTRVQPEGRRVRSLREGWVQLLADQSDRPEMLHQSRAITWLEANASLRERRFFLLDGQWYEIAGAYDDEVRSYVRHLLAHPVSPTGLPDWQPGQDEQAYNLHAAAVRPGQYVCLDRQGVRTGLHRRNGVEICDLLGPDDELIHVKRASSSSPLSHLFAQGLVSAQALYSTAEARKRFADLVRQQGQGRTIAEDYVPKKVVFAILLKNGERVDATTLFPFAQVMLRQTALWLEGKAEVEVVGIPMAPATPGARRGR